MYAGATQLQTHLRRRPAQNQRHVLLAIVAQHIVQRGDGGHVQQRHGADIDDHHAHPWGEAAQHAKRLFRRAEEQRAANGVSQHVLGQILQGLTLLPAQRSGIGQLAHAFDEQSGCQQQADTNGQHHVEQHSQHQAGQQHQHIAARGDAQGMGDVMRFAHVPRHHQQQRRQGGHG